MEPWHNDYGFTNIATTVRGKVPSAQLRRLAQGLQRRTRTPGTAVALQRGTRAPTYLLLGYEDREARRKVVPETVFQIGSITKSVTCLCLLQLQEQGRLSLRDRLSSHVPELEGDARRWARNVTLKHLMSHTSGLPPLPTYWYQIARSLRDDPTANPRVLRRAGIDLRHPPVESLRDFFRELSTLRRHALFPPGTVFSYSNDGYALLGAIVERTSGRNFESYVEENILRRIGTRESTFDTGVMLRTGHAAVPYGTLQGKKSSIVPIPVWWEKSVFRATGALRMSVRDLLRYAQVFRAGGRAEQGRIITKPSLREMVRPRVLIEPGSWYGYGMIICPNFHGHLIWGHGGGLQGCAALMLVAPHEGLVGAAASNFDEGCAPAVLRSAFNDALGLPLDETSALSPPSARATGSVRPDYSGDYRSGEGAWLRIVARRDHLRVEFPFVGAPPFNAHPYGEDQFWYGPAKSPSLMTFHRPPAGRPDRVLFHYRWLRRRESG